MCPSADTANDVRAVKGVQLAIAGRILQRDGAETSPLVGAVVFAHPDAAIAESTSRWLARNPEVVLSFEKGGPFPNRKIVVAGQRLVFLESESGTHNVYVLTPNAGWLNSLMQRSLSERAFNSTQVIIGRKDRLQVIWLRCIFHPKELFELWIVPNEQYILAGEDGVFKGNMNLVDVKHPLIVAHPNFQPSQIHSADCRTESKCEVFLLPEKK